MNNLVEGIEMHIYFQGYDAQGEGVDRESCPYSEEEQPESRRLWLMGWDAGKLLDGERK